MEKIPFDDIPARKARIRGEWGSWGRSRKVTQEMIDRFADLTGDHQWIHVDVERCKRESPFGGPIAHGFLTLSLVPGLGSAEREWAISGYANAVNYGAEKLRFLSPVPAGAELHSRSRLLDAEATPKGTRVVNEIAVHVVGSERPALSYQSIVLYQGRG